MVNITRVSGEAGAMKRIIAVIVFLWAAPASAYCPPDAPIECSLTQQRIDSLEFQHLEDRGRMERLEQERRNLENQLNRERGERVDDWITGRSLGLPIMPGSRY